MHDAKECSIWEQQTEQTLPFKECYGSFVNQACQNLERVPNGRMVHYLWLFQRFL